MTLLRHASEEIFGLISAFLCLVHVSLNSIVLQKHFICLVSAFLFLMNVSLDSTVVWKQGEVGCKHLTLGLPPPCLEMAPGSSWPQWPCPHCGSVVLSPVVGLTQGHMQKSGWTLSRCTESLIFGIEVQRLGLLEADSAVLLADLRRCVIFSSRHRLVSGLPGWCCLCPFRVILLRNVITQINSHLSLEVADLHVCFLKSKVS